MSLFRRGLDWIRRHSGWLRWLLALLVLGFLFHKHREGVQAVDWRHIQWDMFALAVGCCLCSLILTQLRWYLLVWAQDMPFGIKDALRLGFIGYLFNYVAPGAVGGDLIKASMIAREQTSRRLIAVATVFLDRMVGLVGLLLLGAAMMAWPTPVVDKPEFQTVIYIFQIGAVFSLIGFLVALLPWITNSALIKRIIEIPKVGQILGEIINSIRLYQARWRVLVASLGMSLFSHTVLILAIYFCALALHGTGGIPSLVEHMQLIPPAELVGVVVPLPGGTGALEEAVAHFYRIAGASFDHGFLTAIAYRIVTIVIAIIGAIYYMMARREIDSALQASKRLEPAKIGAESQPSDPTLP